MQIYSTILQISLFGSPAAYTAHGERNLWRGQEIFYRRMLSWRVILL